MCSGLLSGWFRRCRQAHSFQKLSERHWWTRISQDHGENASGICHPSACSLHRITGFDHSRLCQTAG
jgi:hypothetical protein